MFLRLNVVLLVAFLVLPRVALAKGGACDISRIRLPAENKMLSHFGEARLDQFDREFEVLVWNVLKGDRRPQWDRDMLELGRGADLILLQEGMLNDHMPPILRSFDGFLWNFVTSFIFGADNKHTGVVGGSRVKPLKVLGLRSPGREPILNSPKTSVVMLFDLADKEEHLLVINIHAINFRLDQPFREHISQNLAHIRSHQGPVIFAGDFNTWNASRTRWLDTQTAQLGLHKIPLRNDNRLLRLDHVYARGLNWREAALLPHIRSSDHAPIRVRFVVP
ncbi:MAG: endonuclease/exonuclease/phosphatase family protein [Bdellovibrionaceae bacterium]|nr:endonuclease/exonuclease/phosphatase family protein [Pseudobdellovibrionaceae bacterium]